MSHKLARRIVAAGIAAAALGGGALVAASGKAVDGLDPHAFGARSASNPWQPLTPGLQSVAKGFVNVGSRTVPHLRVYTVTDVVKQIDGVRATVVLDQDIDAGQVAEQALDFLAVDRQGTVRYLGSYTESYEGGQFVNALDGWLGGVRGAIPGILMPAHPKAGTAPYYEQQVPGLESPTAQVVKTGQTICVPFRCYKRVVVIQEGDEYKYFAPGVGGIRTAPIGGGGPQESENLINVKQLGKGALGAIDAEVLRLDRHARTTIADVFARSAPAKRAP